MRRTKTPTIVGTTELCGEPYDPQDPVSPRCVVIKDAHRDRPHQAIGRNGKSLEWPVKPKPVSP